MRVSRPTSAWFIRTQAGPRAGTMAVKLNELGRLSSGAAVRISPGLGGPPGGNG